MLLPGRHDHREFLFGIYGGSVSDFGRRHLGFFFSPHTIRGERIIQLAAGTLGAALLSTVVWLPALLQYLISARGGNLFQSLGSGALFSPLDTIGMLLLCTSIVIPAFLFQSLRCARGEMKDSKEAYTLVLFVLMLIPVVVEPINKIWHTGSYQAFPGRYGYILVLLGLCLAAQILQRPAPAVQSFFCALTAALFFLLGFVIFAAFFLWNRYPKTLTAYTRTLWGNDQSLQIFLIFSCWQPDAAAWVYFYTDTACSAVVCWQSVCVC